MDRIRSAMRAALALASATAWASLAFASAVGAVEPVAALGPVEIYVDGFVDLRGIVVDAKGNVFVADRAVGTVTRIAPDRSGALVASGLERPIGLAFDPAGRLLIAEEKAGRVVRVEPNGSRAVIVSGVKQPRWLAARGDGTLFISARRLTRDSDSEPDDESAEAEVILELTPLGQLRVFADGLKSVGGLSVSPTALFAATQGRRGDAGVDGVVVQIPILGDGSAGAPVRFGPSDELKKPVDLARDRLGALYLTTKELGLAQDPSKRAVAKLSPTAVATLFAQNLAGPQGVAFDADGNLYVADGSSGRVLRFLAPPAPTVTAPDVTNQSPLTLTGTTLPGARVDLFVNGALAPVSVSADAAGAFSATITLRLNASNTLEVFATTHGDQGLTATQAEATIVHDDVAPTVTFSQPPASAYVRGAVTVSAQARDANNVASLALSADAQPLAPTLAPRPPASAVMATVNWTTLGVGDGTHTLIGTTTDQAGNTATTTRVVIVDNTPPDTEITGGPSGQVSITAVTFTFTGTDNLTPVANLQFAWRLDGGPWSSFAAATTATVTNLTPGPHTFEVKALDLAGNESAAARQSFTVGAGVRVTITDPADGATVRAGLVLVRGTVEAGGQEVGIAVNGVPAAVHDGLFAALVPLAPGTVVLTAVGTTSGSGTNSQSVTVTISGASQTAELLALPQSGLAPLTVGFTLPGGSGTTVSLDADGDGVVDFIGPALGGQAFTYARPGLYFPVVTTTDSQGNQVTARAIVHAYDRATIDAFFKTKWSGMKSALIRSDVEGAVAQFRTAQQDRYRALFTALSGNVAPIARDMQEIELIYLTEGRAKYRLPRTQVWGGRLMTLTYYVYFVQDGSGFWALESF